MNTYFISIILFILFLTEINIAYSQGCSLVPPTGNCTSGCTSTLTNGANVNGGQVYCYTGTGILNNINLNGGTIRVCGNLTINNLNINSGVILITTSGTLTIAQNKFFNGNVKLINYGIVNFLGNLTLQNSNNYIYNANIYNQTGQLKLNSSTSYFINTFNHTAAINNLFINSGRLCLEDNSILIINNLTNNQNNTASFNSLGNACVRITGIANINATAFSDDPEIGICLANGVSVLGGGGWGAVSVYNNCNSCSAPLPIELINFSVNQFNGEVVLEWSTASELNNDYFTIERSNDSKKWKELSRIQGTGSSSFINKYLYKDSDLKEDGGYYYRLKQTDFDGKEELLATRYVNYILNKVEVFLYPNPTNNIITIEANKKELEDIKIYNFLGEDVTNKIERISTKDNIEVIDLSNLISGLYTVKTKTTANKVYKK